jgi:hypothetical protein
MTTRTETMKPRHDLDRSVAFSLLLEFKPGYGDEADDHGEEITRFLAAWYLDPSLDMGEFAHRWVAGEVLERGRATRTVGFDQRDLTTLWVKGAEGVVTTVFAATGTGRSMCDGVIFHHVGAVPGARALVCEYLDGAPCWPVRAVRPTLGNAAAGHFDAGDDDQIYAWLTELYRGAFR